jgi:hypothetical protein
MVVVLLVSQFYHLLSDSKPGKSLSSGIFDSPWQIGTLEITSCVTSGRNFLFEFTVQMSSYTHSSFFAGFFFSAVGTVILTLHLTLIESIDSLKTHLLIPTSSQDPDENYLKENWQGLPIPIDNACGTICSSTAPFAAKSVIPTPNPSLSSGG